MKRVYINGIGCVSPQPSFEGNGFPDSFVTYDDPILPVIDPPYRDFIPASAIRRMAKGIKMGVAAAQMAMTDAGMDTVEAIITGTGLGCTIDSEKFLENMIDNHEEYLTPTSFVQSTHNTLGGQIALGMGCTGYNFTYVHGNLSFESALMDAFLQIKNDEANDVLVGSMDETGAHTSKLYQLIGHIKQGKINSGSLYTSGTPGSIAGQGAQFFVCQDRPGTGCYTEVAGISIFNNLPKDDVEKTIQGFLSKHGMTVSDLDAVILGVNGDAQFDGNYNNLRQGIFSKTPQLAYKHLSGEYYTASAFGIWTATNILRFGRVPETLCLNNAPSPPVRAILHYQQYRNADHGLILLRSC